MKHHLPAFILASLLAIVLAAGAFVAAHAHGSGYYVVRFDFGRDYEPAEQTKVAEAKPPAVLKDLPPPKHKPTPPKANMPGDGFDIHE